MSDAASSSVTIGIAAGLVIGKIVGIGGAVLIAVRLGVSRLPGGATMTQMFGVCAVAGIGFTVSLFISNLAYEDEAILSQAKIGVLAASIIAAVIGATILTRAAPPTPHHPPDPGFVQIPSELECGGEAGEDRPLPVEADELHLDAVATSSLTSITPNWPPPGNVPWE